MSSVSNSTPTSDQRKPDSHSVIPKDTEENSSVLSMDLSPASPKMTGLDLWSPDQHNESLDSFPSENEDSALEEISSLPKEVTPSNAPESSAFQLDGLLPPESLAPANIHVVESMDQAVVESKEESDRKLQEEADAELGPLLSSDPVSPLPAETESIPNSSNSSSRVPALGLEALGEGASHSVSLQPTHQKYAESSDSEEALQAKPTPVNTSQPISLSPHKEKVEIASVEIIERDKERAREAEASADLLVDIIKDNVELILPHKIDRSLQFQRRRH